MVDEYAQLRGKSGEEEGLPLRVWRRRGSFLCDNGRGAGLAPEEEEFSRVVEEWVRFREGVMHYWILVMEERWPDSKVGGSESGLWWETWSARFVGKSIDCYTM